MIIDSSGARSVFRGIFWSNFQRVVVKGGTGNLQNDSLQQVTDHAHELFDSSDQGTKPSILSDLSSRDRESKTTEKDLESAAHTVVRWCIVERARVSPMEISCGASTTSTRGSTSLAGIYPSAADSRSFSVVFLGSNLAKQIR